MIERSVTLDLIRGTALILMMMFHLSFDLNFFHIIDIDIYRAPFWKYARWVILSMFLFTMGYALVLAYGTKLSWRKLLKRERTLGLYALLISFSTYFIFPSSWIYFGVLHFFFVASLLGLLFIRIPWIALGVALFIFIGNFQGWLHTVGIYEFFRPLLSLPRQAEDLVPIFPWFAIVLLGIFAANIIGLPVLKSNKILDKVTFLGRHSLIVYMIHQPIFFGILYLFSVSFL